MVNHSVGALANLVESAPSTKLTVCGAVPWAITMSGFSLPVVKIGTILSKYLIFLTSIACRLLAGKTFLHHPVLDVADVERIRLRHHALHDGVGIERRHLQGDAEVGLALLGDLVEADTPVPHWRSTMFLLFCAQIVGKPVIAPLPSAAPARPAAPFRTLRRPRPSLTCVPSDLFLLLLRLHRPRTCTSSGVPRQNHRLRRRRPAGVEARLRHHGRQGLRARRRRCRPARSGRDIRPSA